MIGTALLNALPMDWNDGHMGGGNGRGIVVFLCLVLAVAVIAVVVWLVVRRGHDQPRSGLEGARSILAERLARGEIEPDEYRERLQHLQ